MPEENMVDISGLSKGAVLAALYNASKPLGMGMLHFDPAEMTEEDANALIERLTGGKLQAQYMGDADAGTSDTHAFGGASQTKLYFDYVKGRVMKVDITGDELNPWGFDRDNGEGAAERAIAPLRSA